MKYALVNGERQEAQSGISGTCPSCERTMVAKCGEIKIHHWAHLGKRTCDPWWENETEWHRGWKGHFPTAWQEVVHFSESGEKHIADVKTDQGWTLEFQHSYLSSEERRARDNFYGKLVWVVDGTRRKRDATQFLALLNRGSAVGSNGLVRKVDPNNSALLQEWASGDAPVFFDFGEQSRLWWLLPKSPNGVRDYIAAFSRPNFIELHLRDTKENQEFEKFISEFSNLVSQGTSGPRSIRPELAPRNQQAPAPQSFQQHLAQVQRARFRRRF